jgi:hypothetical protein
MRVVRESAAPAIVNLQEATVPQVFSQLAHWAIDAQQMLSRLADAGRKSVAWTLSRDFWQ